MMQAQVQRAFPSDDRTGREPGSETPLELSIVMPCLDEAETLAICIRKAQRFLKDSGIAGEIIIADNGSTDGSRAIANAMGARIVGIEERGYGAALRGGIAAARGRFVVMGDADDSYDFLGLLPFVDALREGADLVMGNRFRGGIRRGAMPPLHRYLGNPVLSFLGRLFFGVKVGDFHCGLRAFRRDAIHDLELSSNGMEYASEMVVKAALRALDIREVPTTLDPDGRSRAPHLRTWRDGWRHLRFLLTYAPKWLFVYPGALLGGVGALGVAALSGGEVALGRVELSVTTLLFAAMAVLVGGQLVGFGLLARLYGIAAGIWPAGPGVAWFRRHFSVERGCVGGAAALLLGLGIATLLLAEWARTGFGPMNASAQLRFAIPAVLASCLGLQAIFTSFMVALIDQPRGG